MYLLFIPGQPIDTSLNEKLVALKIFGGMALLILLVFLFGKLKTLIAPRVDKPLQFLKGLLLTFLKALLREVVYIIEELIWIGLIGALLVYLFWEFRRNGLPFMDALELVISKAFFYSIAVSMVVSFVDTFISSKFEQQLEEYCKRLAEIIILLLGGTTATALIFYITAWVISKVS